MTRFDARPTFQVGECFRFTTANHTDTQGKVLAVKEASYYVEVETNSTRALKYTDIIPIARLHRLATRVPCQPETSIPPLVEPSGAATPQIERK